MTESNQTSAVPLSVSKEKKAKNFFEHGKDALGLAISVANMQEEKALRKAEKHQRLQDGKSRAVRTSRNHTSNRKKRLEEAKVMIANRRAEAKKEKARCRKEAKGRLRQGGDVKITAPDNSARAAPRKKVSFCLSD